MRKKPIVVGIDPGTTAAIAFLDAYGEPIRVKSSRRYSEEKLIKEIRKAGDIMILGTDKSDLPGALKDIAAKFNCKVYSPKKDLSKKGKTETTEPYRHMVSNEHEKDALASAIKAYKANSKRLRKIRRRNPERYEEVVRKKLLGLERRTKKQDEGKKEDKKKERRSTLQEKVKNLETKIQKLKKRIKTKEGRIKELEEEIDNLEELEGITEREALLQSKINKLQRRNQGLEDKIRELTEAWESKEIKKVTEDQMRKRNFTTDTEAFKELKEEGKEAHLIEELHQEGDSIYYKEIDHCKPSSDMVKNVLEEYKSKRKEKK